MSKSIQNIIWDICNDIRDNSSLNHNSAQPYILGFMFYKFLSEKIYKTINDFLKDEKAYINLKNNKEYENAKLKCIEKIGYFIDYKDSYMSVLNDSSKNPNIVGDRLSKAFKSIEDSTSGFDSSKDFRGLFSDIKVNSTILGNNSEEISEMLILLLKSLDKPELNINNMKDDQLGDTYEFLISKYASEGGQKAGEFYTPSFVSKLLANIATLGIKFATNIYDPTCGSGSLLLRVKDNIEQNDGKFGKLFGQEKIGQTFNLARMNMFLHGIKYKDFEIANGNTLIDSKFKHFIGDMDIIVANPPFSTSWKPEEYVNDMPYREYPKMAPEKKADYAFVQHMLYMLKEKGRAVVIVPHGLLFRGGGEGSIRKTIVGHKKYLRAVIGLPSNLFFNAAIPTCILVFEKETKDEDVLFIEASKEFIKDKSKNKMSDENINKIFDVYSNKKEIDKFSRLVPLKEIEENEFNLNITRYIDTFEEEEEINIDEVEKELKNIEFELSDVENEIKLMIKDLKKRVLND